MDPPKLFQGFRSPNYTPVPDELFDELLSVLSGSELKVLLYIIRRTFGFKRSSDTISLSQMLNGISTRDGRLLDRGAGVSKPSLLQALRSLQDANIIIAERQQSDARGNEPTLYHLNVLSKTLGQETYPPLVKELDQGGGQETLPTPRSRNLTTQETVEQQTVRQQTELHNSNLRKGSRRKNREGQIGEREGGVASVAEVLSEKARPDGEVDYGEDRQRIGLVIETTAGEFGDQAALRSSVSRAYHLFERSGLSISRFEDLLYESRAVTKEWTSSIKKVEPDGTWGIPRKNKMPYFFSVLEDRVERATGQKRLVNAPEAEAPSDDGLWQAILSVEKLSLDRQTYDTWLTHTRQLSLADDTLYIAVPTPAAREWLSARLASRLEGVATRLTRRQIRLEFVDPEAASGASPPRPTKRAGDGVAAPARSRPKPTASSRGPGHATTGG